MAVHAVGAALGLPKGTTVGHCVQRMSVALMGQGCHGALCRGGAIPVGVECGVFPLLKGEALPCSSMALWRSQHSLPASGWEAFPQAELVGTMTQKVLVPCAGSQVSHLVQHLFWAAGSVCGPRRGY